MKIKRMILGMVVILIGSASLPVSAAEYGSIRVELPETLTGATVCCLADDEEEIRVQTDEQGIATLENLKNGVYHIQVLESQGYQFTEAEVKLPMWDDVEKKMTSHVTVVPKYNRVVQEPQSPQTGDQQPLLFYGLLAGSSLLVFGIWKYQYKRNAGTRME